jgi:hypothetical protein
MTNVINEWTSGLESSDYDSVRELAVQLRNYVHHNVHHNVPVCEQCVRAIEDYKKTFSSHYMHPKCFLESECQ